MNLKKIMGQAHFFSLYLLILVMDLWTKSYFAQNYDLGQSKPIIKGFFNFTLVHNKGAAFGMGSTWSAPFFLGTSFIAMGVVLYLFKTLKSHEVLSRWGLVMILAGATGNLVDRIRLGYVIDFLDVYYKSYHWPVFNIADSAITVGAVLFALDSLFCSKKSAKFEDASIEG